MSVSYRGKNKLGAMVLEEATVLFDKDYNAIKVLPKMKF